MDMTWGTIDVGNNSTVNNTVPTTAPGSPYTTVYPTTVVRNATTITAMNVATTTPPGSAGFQTYTSIRGTGTGNASYPTSNGTTTYFNSFLSTGAYTSTMTFNSSSSIASNTSMHITTFGSASGVSTTLSSTTSPYPTGSLYPTAEVDTIEEQTDFDQTLDDALGYLDTTSDDEAASSVFPGIDFTDASLQKRWGLSSLKNLVKSVAKKAVAAVVSTAKAVTTVAKTIYRKFPSLVSTYITDSN